MPSEEERDSTYLAAEVSWGHVVVVTASLYNGVPGRRPGGSRLVVVAAVQRRCCRLQRSSCCCWLAAWSAHLLLGRFVYDDYCGVVLK